MNRKTTCALLCAPAVCHVFLLVLIVSSALPPRGLVLTV